LVAILRELSAGSFVAPPVIPPDLVPPWADRLLSLVSAIKCGLDRLNCASVVGCVAFGGFMAGGTLLGQLLSIPPNLGQALFGMIAIVVVLDAVLSFVCAVCSAWRCAPAVCGPFLSQFQSMLAALGLPPLPVGVPPWQWIEDLLLARPWLNLLPGQSGTDRLSARMITGL